MADKTRIGELISIISKQNRFQAEALDGLEEKLTPEEKAEQQKLRKEFIANVRANVRSQLDQITIENEDGTLENLGEKYGGKRQTH